MLIPRWATLAACAVGVATSILYAGEVYAAPGQIGAYTVNESTEPSNNFDLFVTDQVSYDTNLFRLPANSDQLDLPHEKYRTDWLNSATAGAEGEYLVGLQDILFSVHADDNRFDRNKDLDNVSGGARALWNWRVGSVFLGDAGADYSRRLAGFESTGYLGRDIIAHENYFGDARWQVGPRWALFGGVVGTNTTDSAPQTQGNDGQTKSARGGAELATSVNNAVGVEYRYTQGHYKFSDVMIAGAEYSRNFDDNSLRGYVKYQLTDKTTVFGSAGYLKRSYIDSSLGAFSGNVWSASLQWQATDKTLLALAAARDLQAYLDAQSDYFVSQGFGLTASWLASEKITLKGALAWHDQNYIGSSPIAIEDHSRHDKLEYAQMELDYAATRALSIDIACHTEKRQSNQDLYQYRDTLTTASITYKFL